MSASSPPRRRAAAALAAALALVATLACGERARITGPQLGAIPLDPGTFEAGAEGFVVPEFGGGADFGLLPSALAGLRCHIVLQSAQFPSTLQIWIGSELRPRLRTYLWGVDPVPFDRFMASFDIIREAGVVSYEAVGGSVRVTNNVAGEVAGEFTIELARRVPTVDTGDPESLTLQGAFRALPDSSVPICRDPES